MHFLFQLKLSRGHRTSIRLGSEQLVAAAVELRQQLAHHTLHPVNHHHPSTHQSGKPWRNSASDFRAQMTAGVLMRRWVCAPGQPALGVLVGEVRQREDEEQQQPRPLLRRPSRRPSAALLLPLCRLRLPKQDTHPTIRRAKGHRHRAQMFSACRVSPGKGGGSEGVACLLHDLLVLAQLVLVRRRAVREVPAPQTPLSPRDTTRNPKTGASRWLQLTLSPDGACARAKPR